MVHSPDATNLHETTEFHSPFLEVALGDQTSGNLLHQAMDMPAGIYGNLVERSEVLTGVPQYISETLRNSEAGQALTALGEGGVVTVRLTGLPTDPTLPPSPLDGGVPHDKNTYVSEAIGLGIGYMLGNPSLLLGEKEEALVHQITPVAGRETTQSNEGQIDLKLHQDLAPHPDFLEMPYDRWMPDWLVLTGVRLGAGITHTSVASVDEALALLDPRQIEILSQKRFVTNPPESFVKQWGGEMPARLPVHPVLRQYEGYIESAFDISSQLRPHDYRDEEAAEALNELEAAFTQVRKEVVIAPGTALAFNNRRVVHGRGAVTGKADSGDKRWIQRVYVFDAMRMFKTSPSWFPITYAMGHVGVVDAWESEQRILELNGNK